MDLHLEFLALLLPLLQFGLLELHLVAEVGDELLKLSAGPIEHLVHLSPSRKRGRTAASIGWSCVSVDKTLSVLLPAA